MSMCMCMSVSYKVCSVWFSGVAEIINRIDGLPFDDHDEQLFEVRYGLLNLFLPDDIGCIG